MDGDTRVDVAVIGAGLSSGGPWPVWLVAAMLGSVLTLASFVKVLHAVFLGVARI